jgi:putative peptidoglycan lipid II flippase
LLPLLSRSLVAEKFDEANQYFNRAIEACLLFALPAAVALIIAAKPIVFSLFNYGAFELYDANMTSLVLTCYALGLPAYIVAKVFQSACFARQDTKTPVKISIISAISNIIVGLTLSQYIGVAGIALATAISGFIQITLLYRVMKRTKNLSFDIRLKVNALKIIGASMVMGAIVFGYYNYCRDIFTESSIERVIALIGLVACGGLGYLVTLILLRTYSRDDLRLLFKNK